MEGYHTIWIPYFRSWKDFLPHTWISHHIPGFPTTYLFFLPHTLVGLDVAVALNEVGYEDTWSYFLGQSKFNQSVYGWAGHTEDSGTIGTVSEILARVSDYKIENIFDRVYVYTKDQEEIDIPWEHFTASKINYPDNCRSLALSSVPQLKGERIQQLYFYTKDFENHAIKIHFNGATLDCRRNIREHSFQASGDAIKLKKENNLSRA